MPSNLSNEQLIQLAEDVAFRQVIHEERGQKIMAMAVVVRNNVVWRTTLHSSTAAANVWAFLEGNGVDMEDLMSMTAAFKFRAGVVGDDVYEQLADSLGWSRGAKALPKEISQFSSSGADYKQVLKENPWLCFLYLMSMSALIQRLDEVLPKRSRPPRNQEEPKQ